MNKLALIGKDISHSLSQKIYESLLGKQIDYTLIDCFTDQDIPSLDELFSKYEGVSITAPYKKHFLDKVILTDEVRALDAINCLSNVNGKYYGTNTDFLAIKDYFLKLKKAYQTKIEVIILGDGSMSMVTESLLKVLEIKYSVLSRKNGDIIEKIDLTKLFKNKDFHNLVINSCGRSFVFRGTIDSSINFWDYNYKFKEHFHLMSQCRYTDGLKLLESQAAFALEFWKK